MITSALKNRSGGSPDFNSLLVRVRTLRSAGLYHYQHVEVDSSLFVSERICGVRCRESSITPSFRFYFHFLFIVN